MKLLSFGADEDGEAGVEAVSFKKKPIFRPDCTSLLLLFFHRRWVFVWDTRILMEGSIGSDREPSASDGDP